MSGIFGIVHRDGRPVARESLEAMRRAMAFWGPHGSGVVRAGEAGLGQLMLHSTPESLGERLPWKSADGLLFTAGSRIDNRCELFHALGVPPGERDEMPDGALILRAYREWGADCADRLLGDWAFAVWDPRRRRLFLARDHHGNTGLYTFSTPRLFAFASAIKGLLALPEVPRRPDRLRIVQILTSWPGDGVATCYEEIRRLPPAHTLTVTPKTIASNRYWRLEDTPERDPGSDEEVLEAFLERYAEAVRCRLRSPRAVGVTLSGGLDSSSVAALTARELAREGRRLAAFSAVPLYDVAGLTGPSRFGDETPFIEATRRFVDNLDVSYVQAREVSPVQGIERALDLHDEPDHTAGNQFWFQALLAAARDRDIGTLLVGQHGNGTVSWRGRWPDRVLASLRRRRWGALRAAIRGRVIQPIAPSLYRWYQRRRAGRDPWLRYSAVDPEMARALDIGRRMASSGHDPTFAPPTDARDERFAILQPGRSIIGAMALQSGAGYAMELRDPSADKRLMAFCVSLPDRHYADDDGDRLLLRRGFEGLLPGEVLWNEGLGYQAADIGRRVLEHAAEMESALARLERSDLAREFLDLRRMLGVYRALRAGIDRQVTREVATILLRGLMAGLFLRRFEVADGR